MSLLIDLFGYLSIVIHGLTILAQSMMIGGLVFIMLLVRPLARRLEPDAARAIAAGTTLITAWAAIGLAVTELVTVAMQAAILIDTVDLSLLDTLSASFAVAGLVKAAAALLIAALLFARRVKAPRAPLLVLAIITLIAATATTHAAARLSGETPLLLAEGLHQLGAAIWIGGIPAFLLALARIHDGIGWRLVAERFSRLSMLGVACILVSGMVMTIAYVGSIEAFYGTAFGVMVGAKIVMFAMLLGLGGMNFLLVRRLRADLSTPVRRMKRFAEVEVGIGLSIFFAAASLTSVPPGIDLTQDRVTWQEILDRNAPVWPRLASPDHDALALPALQAKLDAEAAAHKAGAAAAAFIPGSGELPPRNAADIAWSEYNHHWAGLFVLAIGLLALANQAGARWARHWPLIFLGLAVFLFLRSDPEVWPLGEQDFFASFRDVEVLQHRMFVVLVAAFGLFEWRVRTGWGSRAASLVFPLVCAGGGALLLTHSHAISNVKDQLLIELTHTPLALTAIVAGWARWLELRLPAGCLALADGGTVSGQSAARIAAWVWPVCFVLIGLMLLSYREA